MDLPLLPRIALTPGEPAGIGPDITLQLSRCALEADVVVFADPEMLAERARRLGLKVVLHVRDTHYREALQPGHLKVVPVPAAQPAQAGELNPANAGYVLDCLRRACQGCLAGDYDALVTGPVHKGVINDAGIPFSGHTEFLAELTHTPQVVMMLATPALRVALATTHLPLAEVSRAITRPRLEGVIRILQRDLQARFGLAEPRILVCGLNPHAGEGGHLGREEVDMLIPLLDSLREEGLRLTGPVPADTAFTRTSLAQADVVLAMYHDQGLPVLKAQGFGDAVNITLGLPIIRTSVDHGTALSLAGSGQAHSNSLHRALSVACEMAAHACARPAETSPDS